MPDDIMLQEAIQAVHNGEKIRARDILTRLIKTDPTRADYWVWMSAVVETSKERLYCLQEARKHDAQNISAQRGLAIMGAYPAELPRPKVKPAIKRSWQPAFPEPAKKPKKALGKGKVFFILAWAVAGMVLVGVVFALFAVLQGNRNATAAPRALGTAKPSSTYLPTSTSDVILPTPTFTGPTPLWMLMAATYTPTPIYVNTPHPRSEAYRSGYRAYQEGDYATALTFLNQAISSEPDAVDVYYYLGEVYRIQGQNDQAITEYNNAIQINPQFAPAYLGRAFANRAKGSSDNDIQPDLETAFSLDPGLSEAALELARISLAKADPAKTIEIVDTSTAVHPDVALLYVYRGQANLMMGNAAQALVDAQKANLVDETLLDAYLLLGSTYQANNQMQQSIQPLEVYLRYQTSVSSAWNLLGKAYLAVDRTDDALNAYTQALALEPTLADALTQRGWIYLNKGDAQSAMTDLFSATQQDDASYSANLGLARALFTLNYPDDAYLRFTKALNLSTTDDQRAQVYYYRALTLEALSNSAAAQADWTALASLPEGIVPAEWLAEANTRFTPTPAPELPTALNETPSTPAEVPGGEGTVVTTETPVPPTQ